MCDSIKNKLQRLDYLDYVKGFAILLVVFGHTLDINSPIRIWIYSFHMPLFFIVCGMLIKHTNLEDRNFKTIIISRFKRIMVPYFAFEIILILIGVLIQNYTVSQLPLIFIQTFSLFGSAGATWFLPCIFVGEIVFLLIKKFLKKDCITLGLSLGIFLIPLILNKDRFAEFYSGNSDSMAATFLSIIALRFCIALGFIAIGYYGYKYVTKVKLNILWILLFAVINIVLCEYNGFLDLWRAYFANPVFYVICSILGSFSILFLFKEFKEFKNWKVLSFFGTNSIVIVATQQFILDSISRFTSQTYYNYLAAILIFVLVISLEVPLIYLINRYIPWLNGKKNRKVS